MYFQSSATGSTAVSPESQGLPTRQPLSTLFRQLIPCLPAQRKGHQDVATHRDTTSQQRLKAVTSSPIKNTSTFNSIDPKATEMNWGDLQYWVEYGCMPEEPLPLEEPEVKKMRSEFVKDLRACIRSHHGQIGLAEPVYLPPALKPFHLKTTLQSLNAFYSFRVATEKNTKGLPLWNDPKSLHIAVSHNFSEALPALFLSLETQGIQGNSKHTALHLAIELGHVNAVEHYLRMGGEVDIPNTQCQTPLHLAVEKGNRTLVRMLLNADADVNTTDYFSRTPLVNAARNGNRDIVNMLLKAGASHSRRDAFQNRALDYARASNNSDIIAALKQNKLH